MNRTANTQMENETTTTKLTASAGRALQSTGASSGETRRSMAAKAEAGLAQTPMALTQFRP